MATTNDRVGSARLPGSGQAATGRGAAAVLVLLVTVVGLPTVLLTVVGNPWPSTVPSTAWLQEPLSRETILRTSSVLVWLLWLHLVMCVSVEIASERGGGLAPSVPGGAIGTQRLARWIVNGIAGLRRAPAAPLPRGSATAHPRLDPDPVPKGGHEPALHRRSRPKPATGPATHPDEAPADAPVKYYEVRPPSGRNFETLWDISDRFLGTGLRHREILELNRGVVQADGRTLSSLDLVQAGWMLRLPHDAEGRELRVSAPVDQVADDTAPAASPADEQMRSSAVFGVGGGPLAAAAVDALRRRRTSGSLARRPGASSEQVVRAEHRLRREADPEQARLLDHAVRGYGATLAAAAERPASVPALSRAVTDADGVTLTFDAAHGRTPRAPWTVGDDGRSWRIQRGDLRRVPSDGPALHPGLVALGRTARGTSLAWDIESADGVISLGGDDTMARGVALSWAVDTAVHAWADQRDVLLVGFAEVPTAVAPRQLHLVNDISPLLDGLEEQAEGQRAACRRLGVDGIRAARVLEPGSPDWTARLVLLSGLPAQDSLERLEALARRRDASVCVVVVGNVAHSTTRLVVSPDGRLWNGPLGIDVRAQRLSVSAAQTLTSVFEGGRDMVPVDMADLDLRDVLPSVRVADRVLDPQAHHDVEIGVLGDVAVDAHGPLEEARRDLLTELVVRVAVGPDGAPHDVLTEAIWPEGVADDERRRALDEAAAWLGRTPAGPDRLAVGEDRVTLSRDGVRFDWEAFVALLYRGAESRAGEVVSLAAALALVRGTPWSDLPTGRYAWLAQDETDSQAATTVVVVARRLAELCARRHDGGGARDAIRVGLGVAPAAEDLWRDALRLASALGGRRDVEAVAAEMARSLSAHGAHAEASPESERLVRDLLARRPRTDATAR